MVLGLVRVCRQVPVPSMSFCTISRTLPTEKPRQMVPRLQTRVCKGDRAKLPIVEAQEGVEIGMASVKGIPQ